MSIKNWSDEILVVELDMEPEFTEDLLMVMAKVRETPFHVVLDLRSVTQLGSSSISQMLRLRTLLIHADKKLRLCGVNNGVWLVMRTTGLDHVFKFADDVTVALAGLQLEMEVGV